MKGKVIRIPQEVLVLLEGARVGDESYGSVLKRKLGIAKAGA